MDYQKIGEYIKGKRKAAGLTQAELSEKLNITSKAVSKWECGIAMPDISLFPELCQIFNISVAELLEGCDKVEDNTIERKLKKKTIIVVILSVCCTILLILSVIFGIYFIKNYNSVRTYDLVSGNSSFKLNGKIISIGKQNYVYLGDLKYLNLDNQDQFNSVILKYELYYGKELLFMKNYEKVNDKNEKSEVPFNKILEKVYLFEMIDKNLFKKDEFLYLKLYIANNDEKVKEFIINISIKLDK